ncbi:hypothetical protein Xen7305DRAFT_00044210 [Xenococcus sp. PCC 7305]|uniref:hypothetical protein n=1 Tax=Xenococcus sp. PCC 7305 TaxID=102125 RepID=UPI0002ACCE84|nr:hypothetical protein [Xenococcus sp. PCC 7305]ELS04685.1 hypothetical protein Xen7305DRAFT_00044210 [Xenococcus sp. PCC 7305]
MKNQKVTSREYKLMLKAKKFQGDEKELLQQVQKYWRIFSEAIAGIVTITNDEFAEPEVRLVRFYDTKDQLLNSNSYVFRERSDANGKKREVTLKFRHRDRYVSQAREMKDQDGKTNKQKFEEDIKPPVFVSLYSFSNKLRIKGDKKLNKLNDPGRLFPDLPLRLGDAYDGDQKIAVVNGFTAYQIVLEGPSFQIDNETKLQCECALIVWYDGKPNKKPVVAEFSFKYKDESKTEKFSSVAALKAFEVFQLLQQAPKLKKWFDPKGPTKTRFAYGYSKYIN